MQSKHSKQNVNIADETLTNYSFLSRYHYKFDTPSKVTNRDSHIQRSPVPELMRTATVLQTPEKASTGKKEQL